MRGKGLCYGLKILKINNYRQTMDNQKTLKNFDFRELSIKEQNNTIKIILKDNHIVGYLTFNAYILNIKTKKTVL